MSASVRLRVRTPKVIFEQFDDEVVAVDLDSGNYYSLRDVAADLWALLVQGCSASDAIAAVSSRHAAEASIVAREVSAFLEELRRERLIEERIGGPHAVHPNGGPHAVHPNGGPHAVHPNGGPHAVHPNGAPRFYAERYTAPVLSRYTDMQELLLLDPIHDVDETGWPSKAS